MRRNQVLLQISMAFNVLFVLAFMLFTRHYESYSQSDGDPVQDSEMRLQRTMMQTSTSEDLSSTVVVTSSGPTSSSSTTEKLEVNRNCPLYDLQRCSSIVPRSRTAMRGTNYWVMYNLVQGSKQFACDQTITYTTHGDFTFMSHLPALVDRWNGPISFAMYAPGVDFAPTIKSIAYLRQCASRLVSEMVTFHLYFDVDKIPTSVTSALDLLKFNHSCDQPAPWEDFKSFRPDQKITYPVNVGRNIARETVMTHFVFPSDVELYPSPQAIPKFLQMIRRNDPILCHPRPKVYVFSIFEVAGDQLVPSNKTQLLSMLKNGTAIPFHHKMCKACHKIPRSDSWKAEEETAGLSVFHLAKRYSPFASWEPIYIATNNDPAYDERLTWEGKMDKMAQGYLMCNLDYDYAVLDNAFLVHAPGIKVYKRNPSRDKLASKQRQFVIHEEKQEINTIFGTKNKRCVLA